MQVINDIAPEVDEAFSVQLQSPQGGARLGDQSVISVNILANDDVQNAFGALTFTQASISVEENAGFISIPVNRTGGTFGSVGAEFEVTGVTATGGGVDFTPDFGSINFDMGESLIFLVVNIVNDVEPELEEVYMHATLSSSLKCIKWVGIGAFTLIEN